jgi:large subunit ribosomal protein L6e
MKQTAAKQATNKPEKKTRKVTVPKEPPKMERVKVKPIGGEKNGGTRVVPLIRPRRFYSLRSVRLPLKNHKKVRPARLRNSITPGTVLTLLAGRFRGKRVIFLKQLKSGLLLVTGPFKINGVPLRRVNQCYVLATSTKLDISSVKIDGKFNDTYFRKPSSERKQKSEEAFFADKKDTKKLPTVKAKDQKSIDNQLLPLIKTTPLLRSYLNASFTLTKHQYPHAMKF